jgi:hypothetical protein
MHDDRWVMRTAKRHLLEPCGPVHRSEQHTRVADCRMVQLRRVAGSQERACQAVAATHTLRATWSLPTRAASCPRQSAALLPPAR